MSDDAQSQQEVFGFLADPATHGGQKVQRMIPHAASVFLAGDRAIKVEARGPFSFLDYSTLVRQAGPRSELAVNARYGAGNDHGIPDYARDFGKARDRRAWHTAEHAAFRRKAEPLTTSLARSTKPLMAWGRAVAAAHAKAPGVEAERWIAALGAYIDEHVEAFGRTQIWVLAQSTSSRAPAWCVL